jgi:sterol desaturase/sphingolipid hydroxylase (fatty acid hydroxylase superfamily)
MPWPSVTLALALGVSTWSILEYALHRFLGHDRRTMPNFFSVEHTRHHAEGNYFAPTWKKALAAVAVFAITFALLRALVEGALAVAYTAGFVGTYVSYEVLHRRAHTHAGVGAYGRFLRRHHFHHHFANPRANHGVTSPLWDLVFGTYEPVTTIRVPAKLAMPWLVDPRTGQVLERFAAHYRVVGRAS